VPLTIKLKKKTSGGGGTTFVVNVLFVSLTDFKEDINEYKNHFISIT
jgi:hypothetical protein